MTKSVTGLGMVTRLQYNIFEYIHIFCLSVMALFILYENHWDVYTKQQKTMKMKVATEKASSLQCCCRRVWSFVRYKDGTFSLFSYCVIVQTGHGQPANCEIFYILCCCSIQFYKTFQKFTNSLVGGEHIRSRSANVGLRVKLSTPLM